VRDYRTRYTRAKEADMKHRIFFGLVGLLAACLAMAETPQVAPATPVAQLAQLTPDALLTMQADKKASLLLLDVRTPEEFAAGHIPGAVNIPYDQVAAHLEEIPKGEEVVLYCHSGRRAGLAAETLTAHGYTKLAHLTGDMQGWQAAGRPVEPAAKP
jgi:phage shock protein E